MQITLNHLLAIETSSGTTSVAWLEDGTIHSLREEQPNKQAERLLPMVSELLTSRGKSPADIQAYAATLGPGSFTGIRIGLSALIGLQAVTPAPFYGASTMELAAFSANKKSPCRVILNAMRGQVFEQPFSDGIHENEEIILRSLTDMKPASCPTITNCSELLTFETVAAPGPDAGKLIEFLLYRNSQKALFQAKPLPIYVRPPDAKLPTKKPL